MIQLYCEKNDKSILPFHQNGLLHWFPMIRFWDNLSNDNKYNSLLFSVGWDIVRILGDIDASDWF